MFKFLFGVAPKVGSTWRVWGGNPFRSRHVKVLETREGWVKFMKEGFTSEDCLTTRDFRMTYTEVKDGKS